MLLTLICAALAAPLAGHDFLREGEAEALSKAMGVPLEQLTHYEMVIELSDLRDTYSGRGTIRWTNRTGKPQSVLPLLLYPNTGSTDERLQIRELEVIVGPAARQETVRVDRVDLHFERPVQAGAQVELRVEYGGRLRLLPPESNDIFQQARESMGSLGAPIGEADYGLLAMGDGLLTAANPYPAVAPFVDGEPVPSHADGIGDVAWNEAASFDMRVQTPAGLRIVSNLVDTRSATGSLEETVCQGIGARDFVLVASRGWEVQQEQLGDITIRSWSLLTDAKAGASALDDAVRSVESLDRRLAPYPFTELDVVEATLVGGAGGVEVSGMTLIAGFLYRSPERSSDPLAQMLTTSSGQNLLGGMMEEQLSFVVAHEVAHQWFPGLVGADAHKHPTVDEPMAQYLAGTIMQEKLGEDEGAAARDRNVLMNFAFYRLLGGEDGAVDRPTSEYSTMLEYAGLVYGKAPYLYVALEEELGREGMDAALRAAIGDHAWGLVSTEDWVASLAARAPQARPLAERYWAQAHGDEDFGLDPEGRVAMQLMLGEEMAAEMEQAFAMLGMSPAQLFRMAAPAMNPQGSDAPAPTLDELDRLLGIE